MNTFSTRFSPKMVSTRSRAGVNKQADASPSGPAGITLDLAGILDGQAKMQQELADLKKRSVDEMEALRQENSRLRQKIEADPTPQPRDDPPVHGTYTTTQSLRQQHLPPPTCLYA